MTDGRVSCTHVPEGLLLSESMHCFFPFLGCQRSPGAPREPQQTGRRVLYVALARCRAGTRAGGKRDRGATGVRSSLFIQP